MSEGGGRERGKNVNLNICEVSFGRRLCHCECVVLACLSQSTLPWRSHLIGQHKEIIYYIIIYFLSIAPRIS